MADEEHVRILKQGVEAWNMWRIENRDTKPDLSGAQLVGANLSGTNLRDADLRWMDLNGADLSGVKLNGASLCGAKLMDAYLIETELRGANLSGANLRGANLRRANLRRADLNMADVSEADLINANLVETNLENTNLTGCCIYGISAWNLRTNEETKQSGLIITAPYEPTITVDNLEVAQFMYLLLHNEKIREAIDTITSKVVLILGRFTDDRKKVLNAIKHELRSQNYTPVLFDFDKPSSRDLTETISILARMARFIIADITDPRSIPQELGAIVPSLPSVPVQPLLLEGTSEYGMFEHFKRYPWVLAIHRYRDLGNLLSSIKENVIEPAEAKVKEIREGKVN